MQNLHVFGSEDLFFFGTLLKKSRKSVNCLINLTLTIVDSKVILGEFLSPPDLFGVQALCINKLFEVVTVCEHKYFILTTF